MQVIQTFSPFSPREDRAAALYLGHLTVAAEAALPDEEAHTQIALCWLCAHVLDEKSRLWRLRLKNIEIEGRPLGSWRITARTTPGPREHISLERHGTLTEEGQQVLALAQPFQEGRSQAEAAESLVAFCAMHLCSRSGDTGRKIDLRDRNGTRVSLEIRPEGGFFRKFFPFLSKP